MHLYGWPKQGHYEVILFCIALLFLDTLSFHCLSAPAPSWCLREGMAGSKLLACIPKSWPVPLHAAQLLVNMSLSSTPWICMRCLHRIQRLPSLRKQLGLRWQSTFSASENISPALLSRARAIAAEHATLSKKLATDYDAAASKRLGELSSTTSAIKEYDKAHSAWDELQALLKSSDKELRELAEDDVDSTQEKVSQAAQALKESLIPIHPFAHLPCLVEIRPGAGGDEAALFAGDLLRMYEAYCSRTGLRTTRLKYETADGQVSAVGSGGVHVQEAVLEVDSAGAYGILRCEAGVHRVQRVPATESKGRTHTSAASVLVLPSVPSDGGGEEDFNDPKSDYYISPTDVRIDVMRAQGAGGQHVNKTESAVRLTHIPTNTVVSVQDSRSQLANREKAWQLLRSRLAQQKREEREEELVRLRRGAGAGKVGRENKVRTYNWGQQRVSDHRSGVDVRNLNEVMEGGEALEKVMESVRAWMGEQEVLGLVAEEEGKREGNGKR
jgi:peptide chain release factor 1